jgi:hypothetical protein
MNAQRYRTLILILVLVLPAWYGCSPPATEDSGTADKACDPTDFPVLEGDYLGQPVPGMEPQLFAPGIVSTGLYERDVVMTPDGKELYFGLMARNQVALVVSRQVDGRWTEPEIAGFSSHPMIYDLEPHITPDGSKFLFLSTRPGDGAEPTPGWHDQDIWAMDRTADGWGEPYKLGPPINSEAAEFFPSTTRTSTIYFTRDVEEDGKTRNLILRSQLVDGEYQPTETLPAEVNAGDTQFNAFIDPDERFLIYGMAGREDAIGPSDYYISFRDEDDTWTGPINMGEKFNTPGNRVVSASLSPNGRYLFFASNRGTEEDEMSGDRNYRQFHQSHGQPKNGNSDIYWVDASIIETFRPE